VAQTAAVVADLAGDRILDVGCGTGRLIRAIGETRRGAELVGVDLSPEMIAVAGEADGVLRPNLVVGDASHLGFADGAFDIVVSSSALHHWPDPLRVLREIARVSRPGAHVVITDWSRDVWIFRPLAEWLSRFDHSVSHIYSRAELEALLRRAGFAIEGSSTYRIAHYWGMMTVTGRRG